MSEKSLKQEQLEKVNGGFVKVTEFSFTLTYEDSSGNKKTGTITASGTNRTYAKPLAIEKAKDWCKDNNCTYISLEQRTLQDENHS